MSTHREAKAVLFEALDRPHAERREWIRRLAADRPEVLAEALELLDQADSLGDFLLKRATLSGEGPDATSPGAGQPETLAGMRILRTLGFGGMGVVYLAQQERPRRQVAVKVLHERRPGSDFPARFRREVEILGRLSHPGIAPIYEAHVAEEGDPEPSWFSMEYVEGTTLGEHVRSNRASRREIAELVARIAEIVAYAHELGILHRDLKPDNVLIDGRGEPRLLDFGVARLAEEDGLPSLHTLTGAVLGTVAYMSPEQARGAQLDGRSDVFSLGVILYELLTERLPFESRGTSLQQLVRSLVDAEPTPLGSHDPRLRGDLEAIVHTAIETDVRWRYASMRDFAADLRRWLAHRPVLARRPTLLHSFQKLLRRNRRLAVASAAVFVALLVALGASLQGLRTSRAAGRQVSRALADVKGLSVGYTIDDFERRSAELWPAGPETLADLRELHAEALDLLATLPAVRAHLEDLRESERLGTLAQRFGGDREVRWVVSMQETLEKRLEGLRTGLAAELECRIGFAEEVCRQQETRAGDWAAAARSIAASPLYRGLELGPQTGLVPLGEDPDSGFHEFAVVLPGCAVPRRDPESGHLALEDLTTLVLVLLPGGRVEVGAQADEPSAPFHDPRTLAHWWPVTRRTLDPFFVSKFEVTQGQWSVLLGDDPSYWSVGKEHDGIPITPRNPVESITWAEALEFCRRLGLGLPTEVQYEYAARGGVTAPTWWGADDPLDPDRVNLNQRRGVGLDEFRLHCPVGTFPANGFGLHEVLGNVAEMCLDDYKLRPAGEPYREGDALVLADGGGERTVRGGGYDQNDVTLAHRNDLKEGTRSRTIGLRPVRPVR